MPPLSKPRGKTQVEVVFLKNQAAKLLLGHKRVKRDHTSEACLSLVLCGLGRKTPQTKETKPPNSTLFFDLWQGLGKPKPRKPQKPRAAEQALTMHVNARKP